jgi:galactoside O-acetyltransferase
VNALGGTYLGDDELSCLGFQSLGTNVKIHERASLYGLENICLGSDIRIDDFVVIIASGPLIIGNQCSIHNFVFMGAKNGITIGDGCTFAPAAKIFSSSDNYDVESGHGLFVEDALASRTEASVIIGDSVLIGSGSVILPGVSISDRASVGALSLVKEDVKESTLVAGVPSQLIRAKNRS